MKSTEKGFKNLVGLGMKYRVHTENGTATCLLCGYQCKSGTRFNPRDDPGGFFWEMERHIKAHIESDELTPNDLAKVEQ